MLNLPKGNVAIATRTNPIGRTQQRFIVLLFTRKIVAAKGTHRLPLRRLTTNRFNHHSDETISTQFVDSPDLM